MFNTEYYSSHPPFDTASNVSIAAVGTVALAIQYGEVNVFAPTQFLGSHCYRFSYCPCFLLGIQTICGYLCGAASRFTSCPCSRPVSPHRYALVPMMTLFSDKYVQVWQLILLQGIGVGVGGGLLYMPVIKLLPEWFSERRGLAGGIIFAGTGVGGKLDFLCLLQQMLSSHSGFVFPFILNTLLEKVGLRWTLRIWAIGTSLCTGVALLGMRSRFPVPKFSAGQRRPKFIPPQLKFLKNSLFWTFVSLPSLFSVEVYSLILAYRSSRTSCRDSHTFPSRYTLPRSQRAYQTS